MKCRKCGNEVDIGEVFCQKCGTALQIVPDYNPLDFEIEVPIEEKDKDARELERRKRRRVQGRKKKKQQQRILLISAAVLIVALLAGGIGFFVHYRYVNSYSYLYNRGREAYAEQNYAAAIQFYKAAQKDGHSAEDDVALQLNIIDCYMKMGDYDRVVELLLDVVNTYPTVEYYVQLMKACEMAENTELMNRILKDTQGTEIGEALSDYRTGSLSASISGGEYHDYLEVSLSNSQSGVVIYYTVDGSDPSVSSLVYTSPIAIEKVGKTVLRAVAVNEAGLEGEELREEYTISLVVPDAPVVAPESGKYEYSQQIEIVVPEGAAAYYTIDGTVPNKETSYLYSEPIIMPVGNSIFSAIIVDKYGVSSNVAKKNYECTIDRAFPYDAAVIKLKNYLVSLGIMSDLNGNRGNGERINVQFVELAQILTPLKVQEGAQEQGTAEADTEGEVKEYYVFTLRRTVDGETATLSEMLYGINTENGDAYTLSLVEGGYVCLPKTTEK
ncbi:MAG: chitobiase/beta-hexosaminidase C-terminal domain-containing protein [Lachnospiraceae bacterium]|nr:chitobiase/beta-hexosaminidase C-terminal domain-containing protein [Lachnospiraceae bacterium]